MNDSGTTDVLTSAQRYRCRWPLSHRMLAWVTRIVDGLDKRAIEPTTEGTAAILAKHEMPFLGMQARCPNAKEKECPHDAVVVVINSKPSPEERWCAIQGLLAINPPYATSRSTHFCKSCSTFFSLEIASAKRAVLSKMSLREVFEEGPFPECPRCNDTAAVKRIVQSRPPYRSPLVMLRGKGSGTGLAALAQPRAGVLVPPPKWPCVDSEERKCTHICQACNHVFRKPAVQPAPDFPQIYPVPLDRGSVFAAAFGPEAQTTTPLRDQKFAQLRMGPTSLPSFCADGLFNSVAQQRWHRPAPVATTPVAMVTSPPPKKPSSLMQRFGGAATPTSKP